MAGLVELWRYAVSGHGEHREQGEAEKASKEAGAEGEKAMSGILRNEGGLRPGHDFFEQKRVYNGRGRSEVDLILLSEGRIVLVEVKAWSGKVVLCNDGRWGRVRRGSETVSHIPNLVDELRSKGDGLLNVLWRATCDVPRRAVHCKVVFVNHSCEVDPKLLATGDVFDSKLISQLVADLSPGGTWLGYMTSIFQAIGTSLLSLLGAAGEGEDVVPRHLVPKVRDVLRNLPTWDTITRSNGGTVVGDVVRIMVDGHTFDRRDLEAVDLAWPVNAVTALFTAIVSSTLGSLTIRRVGDPDGTTYPVTSNPADAVVFHEVGEPHPVTVHLVHVTAMSLGGVVARGKRCRDE